MTILAVSAISIVTLASEATRTVQLTRQVENELAAANAFLAAVSLWPREDFDRRLGERRQGSWLMYVERVDPLLYEVELRDGTTGRLVLASSFFRPDAAQHAD